MAKEVILSPLAVVNYENIVDYLISNWGVKVANDFIRRFELVSWLLVQNPGIYPFVNASKLVQKCVLTKHNTIYFKNTKYAIKILTIFDTRQNPQKLKNLFK